MSRKSLDDSPVTKGDFRKLETRFDNLETRFGGLETRFEFQGGRIEALEKKLEEKFNTMMNHIDGLAKMVKDLAEEFSLHKFTHQRNAEKLENHEKRISRLEVAVIQ